MIYVFLANGFEETEAIAPIDILRRAELEVVTVGVGGKTVRSSHGITVTCDITVEEATPENLDMIVLPGGMPGTLNLEKSKYVQEFVDFCTLNNKWIGAICAAPSILGHKGLLDGKSFICYPGFEVSAPNAKYESDKFVVQQGNIITAKGAGVALEFGFKLAECLLGEKRVKLLKAAMECKDLT